MSYHLHLITEKRIPRKIIISNNITWLIDGDYLICKYFSFSLRFQLKLKIHLENHMLNVTFEKPQETLTINCFLNWNEIIELSIEILYQIPVYVWIALCNWNAIVQNGKLKWLSALLHFLFVFSVIRMSKLVTFNFTCWCCRFYIFFCIEIHFDMTFSFEK